jgi:hypothetical protein
MSTVGLTSNIAARGVAGKAASIKDGRVDGEYQIQLFDPTRWLKNKRCYDRILTTGIVCSPTWDAGFNPMMIRQHGTQSTAGFVSMLQGIVTGDGILYSLSANHAREMAY